MSKGMRTEDEVRDSAKLVLGFDKTEDGVQQRTGQITTFNQLGFRGCNDKPDGWYLPDDASKPVTYGRSPFGGPFLRFILSGSRENLVLHYFYLPIYANRIQ